MATPKTNEEDRMLARLLVENNGIHNCKPSKIMNWENEVRAKAKLEPKWPAPGTARRRCQSTINKWKSYPHIYRAVLEELGLEDPSLPPEDPTVASKKRAAKTTPRKTTGKKRAPKPTPKTTGKKKKQVEEREPSPVYLPEELLAESSLESPSQKLMAGNVFGTPASARSSGLPPSAGGFGRRSSARSSLQGASGACLWTRESPAISRSSFAAGRPPRQPSSAALATVDSPMHNPSTASSVGTFSPSPRKAPPLPVAMDSTHYREVSDSLGRINEQHYQRTADVRDRMLSFAARKRRNADRAAAKREEDESVADEIEWNAIQMMGKVASEAKESQYEQLHESFNLAAGNVRALEGEAAINESYTSSESDNILNGENLEELEGTDDADLDTQDEKNGSVSSDEDLPVGLIL